jgi:gluconate 2-dehydrogenase gamma chain
MGRILAYLRFITLLFLRLCYNQVMIDRRNVLLAGAALLLLPQTGEGAYASKFSVLKEPYQTIAMLHRDLFDVKGPAPSPRMLNALGYLAGVMHDPRIDDDEKQFIQNGAVWLNEAANEGFSKPYYQLDVSQRSRVLDRILEETWGDNWVWTIYAYLFEALLCDPVYGANTHETGWQWLGHEPGYPRPSAPFTELGLL